MTVLLWAVAAGGGWLLASILTGLVVGPILRRLDREHPDPFDDDLARAEDHQERYGRQGR